MTQGLSGAELVVLLPWQLYYLANKAYKEESAIVLSNSAVTVLGN